MSKGFFVIVCCAAGALVACSDGADRASAGVPKAALAHSTFADCAEFREYYADALAREYLTGCWGWGCGGGGGVIGGSAGDAGVASVPAPLAVSETNTQEAGVDENDLIEADPDTGRFYVLRGPARNEVLAVNAVPAESMAITSRQATGDHYAQGLYLDAGADRLVVVAQRFGGSFWAGAALEGTTQLLFYDLSDPDHPQLTDRYEIRGWLLDSRRIGGRLHLVTSSWGGVPAALWTTEFYDLMTRYYTAREAGDMERTARFAAELRARIGEAVQGVPIGELVPTWRQGLDDATVPAPIDCAGISHPQLGERTGLVTVSSIDTDGGGLAHMTAINNTWHVYSSAEHLYLMQSSGGWWWSEAQPQQTAIYRYRIDDQGPARPAGHGVVDGWIYGSYALSEHEGHLRVATTVTDGQNRAEDGGPQQTNHLFVLGDADGVPLEVVGQVRDFMRDESIFAARFIGDRGFVITFRWVDPLFTFDLSNPRAPRLAGELEVPGVSTYLHPYGADQLIAVGRRASADGFPLPDLQLQLFDIATLAAPGLLDSVVIGGPDQWSWSIAGHEPHAFTLMGDVLSVPVAISSGDYDDTLSGFLVYRMAGGFIPIGRVDHKQQDDGSGDGCPPESDGSPAPCSTFVPLRFNEPLRSVLMVENSGRTVLYTLSDAFLKADAVSDALAPIGSLPLAE